MLGTYFSSRSFPFQLGMTTVAARGMAGLTTGYPQGPSARDPLAAIFWVQDISGEIGQQECQEAGRHEERREQ